MKPSTSAAIPSGPVPPKPDPKAPCTHGGACMSSCGCWTCTTRRRVRPLPSLRPARVHRAHPPGRHARARHRRRRRGRCLLHLADRPGRRARPRGELGRPGHQARRLLLARRQHVHGRVAQHELDAVAKPDVVGGRQMMSAARCSHTSPTRRPKSFSRAPAAGNVRGASDRGPARTSASCRRGAAPSRSASPTRRRARLARSAHRPTSARGRSSAPCGASAPRRRRAQRRRPARSCRTASAALPSA